MTKTTIVFYNRRMSQKEKDKDNYCFYNRRKGRKRQKTTIVFATEERTTKDKDIQIETENMKLCARREQSLLFIIISMTLLDQILV
jgi:hypothetical protein